MKRELKGELRRHTDKQGMRWWVVDVDVSIMSVMRAVFPRMQAADSREKIETNYTRVPFLISDTKRAAVDLDWLLHRFGRHVKVPDDDRAYMHRQVELAGQDEAKVEDYFAGKVTTSPPDEMLKPPRDYQLEAVRLVSATKRVLIGDDLGTGKTIEGICVTCLEGARPAVVVCPSGVRLQWAEKINEFLWAPRVEILRGIYPYEIPDADYLVVSYHCIHAWADAILARQPRTLILDEVHELRHAGTKKQVAAKRISERVEYAVGLSATYIYNMAGEVHTVIDTIDPGAMGHVSEFEAEWCVGFKKYVQNPHALGRHLRDRGLVIRRTVEELGLRKAGEVITDLITVEASLTELQRIENVAKVMAQQTLVGSFQEAGMAARKFDAMLRQATGVAKARAVAEQVRQLLESGVESVLVATHHHAVNDILAAELRAYKPVFYNGQTTTTGKETALKTFKSHKETGSRVLVMHTRSGQGIDGLQQFCRHIVVGELDWSPAAIAQFVGRLARPGQTGVVYVYFVTINDGSDPVVMDILGIKKSQKDGLVDLKNVEEIAEVPHNRIAQMAEAYLAKRKAAVFEGSTAKPTEAGLRLASFLSALEYPTATEEAMQTALWPVLQEYANHRLMEPHKEYKLDPQSRIDFMVDSIGIECKISGARAEVYRQLQRYAETGKVKELILVCPWPLGSFGIGNVYVHVVSYIGKSLI